MIEELDSIIKTYKVENVVLEDVIPDDVHRNNAIFKALMYLQGFIMHKLDEYKLPSTFFVSSE
jgi:Holliday junction resolvasome RuvABC endonuclease subunit